jgi:CBS domain-containing protein
MLVQELMTRPAHHCHAGDTLDVAARLMWEHDCGCLPVLDGGGELVGIVTDRDLCMAAYTRGLPLAAIRVDGTMAHTVIVCRPEETVSSALRRMETHDVRRLPVVGAHGQLVGILSLADVVRARQAARAGGAG